MMWGDGGSPKKCELTFPMSSGNPAFAWPFRREWSHQFEEGLIVCTRLDDPEVAMGMMALEVWSGLGGCGLGAGELGSTVRPGSTGQLPAACWSTSCPVDPARFLDACFGARTWSSTSSDW
jgi:hypothetical protein